METVIVNYLKSNSRNKIVIHRCQFDSLKTLDVGFELSKQIEELTNDSRFTLKVKSKLSPILERNLN